ncbi:hypothetical protein LPJ63_002968 [Coemansia sp. RSA 2711]|nr:hypothetical protein LPJ63_002968 [Coemansia sp. RSA 2711]KAJ2312460.1 hypothetical protein IWW54_002076 [Coemansia sp. RSA 2705]
MDGQIEELLQLGQQISQQLADPRVSTRYLAHFAAAAAQEAAAASSNRPRWPAPVQRVFDGLQALGIHTQSRIYHVASSYYSWPLYQRALCMAAPSPAHLCKLVVMENKRWRAHAEPSKYPPLANQQYYCVLVQYVETVSTGAMTDFVRSLDGGAVARKHFNFRLADTDTSLALTGYGKNGISPVAMTQALPVIMCAAITKLQPPVFWLGAGHVDYKLALPVQTFVDATGCMVADISVCS